MLVEIRKPVVVGPTNSFDELPVVADGAARPAQRARRRDRRPDDFNPERFILDDVIADPPDANVGDGLAGPGAGGRRLLVRQLQVPAHGGAGADRQAASRREVTKAPRRDELSVGSMNVENLTFVDADDGKFERLARILVENMRSPDIVAHRGGPGQRRRGEHRGHGRDADLAAVHRQGRGGRRAGLRVPPDRPGGRPGRRPAGRQHPRRLPVPDRPRAGLRRPAGRHGDERDRGGRRPVRPRADVQPGPAGSAQPGVHGQPQAARGRVPLARRDDVRGREPLQLQGRRPAAVRALPAARAGHGAPAPRAGRGRAGVRGAGAGRRPPRARDRDGRPQRLRVLPRRWTSSRARR